MEALEEEPGVAYFEFERNWLNWAIKEFNADPDLYKTFESYYKLKADYEALKEAYDRLNTTYYKLLAEHEVLKAAYMILNSSYYKLKENYDSLNANYTSLKLNYDKLRFDYENLKADYNELKTTHDRYVSELTANTGLMYIFLATTIVFIATTIYFAVRRSKIT